MPSSSRIVTWLCDTERKDCSKETSISAVDPRQRSSVAWSPCMHSAPNTRRLYRVHWVISHKRLQPTYCATTYEHIVRYKSCCWPNTAAAATHDKIAYSDEDDTADRKWTASCATRRLETRKRVIWSFDDEPLSIRQQQFLVLRLQLLRHIDVTHFSPSFVNIYT